MFNFFGFKSVTTARYHSTINNASALTDGRFAVINGVMVELSQVEGDDDSFSMLLGVFDASDVCCPSDTDAISVAYGSLIATFEYHVSAEDCEDNRNCIAAQVAGDQLFIAVVTEALSKGTKTFPTFEEGTGSEWSFCPLADLVDGLAHVEVHPDDGDDWSSDNARAKFSVNRAEGTYMQLSGEPLTLTKADVKELLSVAEQAQ